MTFGEPWKSRYTSSLRLETQNLTENDTMPTDLAFWYI